MLVALSKIQTFVFSWTPLMCTHQRTMRTWSPGTLGVMLQGRLVIIPSTVSTESSGTGNTNKINTRGTGETSH